MSDIKLFESKKVHSYWNDSEEKWYFSVVDIIEILTESVNPIVKSVLKIPSVPA